MNLLKEIESKNPAKLNEEMEIILETLFLYNPRINEILSATKQQFNRAGFMVLKGSKKSADIIIRDRELIKKYHALAEKRETKLFRYTKYGDVYRYIWNNLSHIVNKVAKKKNCKVTHAFRYLNANTFEDEATIKSLLHHNSTRSNHFYTNKLKE